MISSTPTAPSYSRIGCMLFCERKYFYKYHCGLESPEQFAPAYMGSVMHEALEVWHRTGDSVQAQAKLEQAWGSQRFHGDYDWVTPGHASIVLARYMESGHAQDWEVVRLRRSDLDASRLLATDVVEDDAGYLVLAEASFVVDIPGMGPANIRPDMLLRLPTGLRVVDHKTSTSYLGSSVYNTTKYSHQLRLYAAGMAALLGEPVLEGGCNALYTGKSASSDKFTGKLFDSYTFDYSAADFEETKAWYKQARLRMEHMAEHFDETDELGAPQNAGGHCGYCEYSKLCAAPAALRPGLVRMSYKKKEANVSV